MQAEKQQNSEKELVARAREGDPDAFSELVRRHRAKAIGLAQTMTRDTHLAEDIVQEALVKAFLKLGSLTDEKRFAPWLSRIVRNQTYMKLRRGGAPRQGTSVHSLDGILQSRDHTFQRSGSPLRTAGNGTMGYRRGFVPSWAKGA